MFIESVDRIIPQQYDLFIGLDVDSKSYSVTVLDWNGEVRQKTMPANPAALWQWSRRQHAGLRVAWVYEAGPTGYGLYDTLRAAGQICLVTSPSMVPQEPNRRVKTNRLDSLQLAVRLRGGELRGIRVPSPRYRGLRHLTHQWEALARRLRGVKCQIKSLLTLEGLPFPDDRKGWSQRVLDALEKYPAVPAVRFVLQQRVRELRALRREQLHLGREIRLYCRSDGELSESMTCLRSLPGIGWVSGAHLLARVGDWRRLGRPRQLAGFTGLSPREHSTGTRVVRGGITRSGDRHLRNLLIEASWRAIRVDRELRQFYERLVQRNPRDKGARKAIVAVARKLAERIARVLKDRRCYRPSPLPA